MGVKVSDTPHTVAAESQAVCAHSHAIFTNVERIFPHLGRSRISIWDHHLSKRRTIEDRAPSDLIEVAYIMQCEPLARVETNDKIPVLPAQGSSGKRKSRAIRLNNFERLDVSPLIVNSGTGVVARIARKGPRPKLLNANN